ncbi:hypothetical protein HOK51_08435 [Candidatus Woesearchaeota archaeon]|jgi:hypothetical protein|nr:hypothetical protein [Candidatus Woesearchaeota archaeon]MBT6519853.1 hypothetical protein [Candidatus Woesearchaeota archaeon]MBT7367145.1 hypothetical protein [Candidatus Woesearchaeota archaeon]
MYEPIKKVGTGVAILGIVAGAAGCVKPVDLEVEVIATSKSTSQDDGKTKFSRAALVNITGAEQDYTGKDKTIEVLDHVSFESEMTNLELGKKYKVTCRQPSLQTSVNLLILPECIYEL